MKKRCTNSACRKFFRVDSVCPYCGKKYPRLQPIRYSVELVSCVGKICTIKTLRRLQNDEFGLKGTKRLVDSCPVIVGRGLTKEEANRWCELLTEAGSKAQMVKE